MRSLGLDVGDKRTGVAVSDAQGILATPLTVIASEDQDFLINEVLNLSDQYKANCIVIGLPRLMDGELGKQANKVKAFADKLSWQAKQSELNQLDIRLWDERLSTKAAQRLKVNGGDRKGKERSKKRREARNRGFSAKSEVDAIAAAFILQGFIDSLNPEQ